MEVKGADHMVPAQVHHFSQVHHQGDLVGVVKLAACRFCKKLAPNAVAVESNGCALDLGSGLRVVAGLWRQQLSVRSN